MAHDTLHLSALLHDIGTFHRRARPDGGPDHTLRGREVFEEVFAPRLVGLIEPDDVNKVGAAIADHHAGVAYLSQADAMASGLPEATLGDEQPEHAQNELLVWVPGENDPLVLPPLPMESGEGIFPGKASLLNRPVELYRPLWDAMAKQVAVLPNGSLAEFIDGVTALLERFAGQVPTGRADREPGISLFEHSRWTALLADALHARSLEPDPAAGLMLAFGIRGAGSDPTDAVLRELGLAQTSAIIRGGDEAVLVGPDSPALRAAWARVSTALEVNRPAVAGDRFATALAPFGVEGIGDFGGVYADLVRGWDARREDRLWADPAAWSAPPAPPADEPLDEDRNYAVFRFDRDPGQDDAVPATLFGGIIRRRQVFLQGYLANRLIEHGGQLLSADARGATATFPRGAAAALVATVLGDVTDFETGSMSIAVAFSGPGVTLSIAKRRTQDGLARARGAGGDRVWFQGRLIPRQDFRRSLRAALELLADPIRDGGLQPGVLTALRAADRFRRRMDRPGRNLPAMLLRTLGRDVRRDAMLENLMLRLPTVVRHLSLTADLAVGALESGQTARTSGRRRSDA